LRIVIRIFFSSQRHLTLFDCSILSNLSLNELDCGVKRN
jgi:hypothetical protein